MKIEYKEVLKKELLRQINKIKKIHKQLNWRWMEVIFVLPNDEFDMLKLRWYKKSGKNYIYKDFWNLAIEFERSENELTEKLDTIILNK